MQFKTLMVAALALASSSAIADVVLIGHSASTTQLTLSQAKALYLGKTKNLPNGTKAKLFELKKGHASRTEFHQKVTHKSESQLKANWSRLVFTGKATPPAQQSTAELLKSTVAATPGAVGYVDESLVDDSVSVLLKP